MALMKCSECGKEVSNKANVCMNCGNPIQKGKKASKKDYSLLTDSEKEQVKERMKENGEFSDLSIMILKVFIVLGEIQIGISLLILIFVPMISIILLISGIILCMICTHILGNLIGNKMRKFYYENDFIKENVE